MTKIQKREVVKSNYKEFAGRSWQYWYSYFMDVIHAVNIFKEVKAQIIIHENEIIFKHKNGHGRMPLQGIDARQLDFYLNTK